MSDGHGDGRWAMGYSGGLGCCPAGVAACRKLKALRWRWCAFSLRYANVGLLLYFHVYFYLDIKLQTEFK